MSGATHLHAWISAPPDAYDIVTCYFPETQPKAELRLRPCLVTHVLQSEDGDFACMVVFGTKHLKFTKRAALDIIVQNAADMAVMGLPMATRFDLDSHVVLPWTSEFFGCWSGHVSPVLGSLTPEYLRDYAFKMLRRGSR